MCAQATPEEDRAFAIATPRTPWRVASVEVRPHYRLHVRFLDGTEGEVDMAGLVHSPDGGVFNALADVALFAQARTEIGVVTWPQGQDLAPDAMYAAIKKSGVCILS